MPETVEFEDILAVCSACSNHYFLHNEHFTKKKSKGLSSSSISDVSNIKSCHSFEVHYVTTHLPKCKVETVTFCHSDLSIVTKWIDTLRLRVESKDFIRHFQWIFMAYSATSEAVTGHSPIVGAGFKLLSFITLVTRITEITLGYTHFLQVTTPRRGPPTGWKEELGRPTLQHPLSSELPLEWEFLK